MAKSDKKEEEKPSLKDENNTDDSSKEKSIEEKLKVAEEKLLRTMAEMENQRRRFEKEKEEAFEFGGFYFAKETLTLIDNLDRAKISISNDEIFKKNKDLPKILANLEIVQKDLVSIFKKNGIECKEIVSVKGNIISKIVNLIYLLDYTSIYRAIIMKNDPTPVNSIDFIKSRL